MPYPRTWSHAIAVSLAVIPIEAWPSAARAQDPVVRDPRWDQSFALIGPETRHRDPITPQVLFDLARGGENALRNAVAHRAFDAGSFQGLTRRDLPLDHDVTATALMALVDRPRVEAFPLVEVVLEDLSHLDLKPIALAAADPETLTRSDVWTMFDATEGFEEKGLLTRANGLRSALRRLPPELADRVVGEALRRLTSGADFGELSVLLERCSTRGRARLAFGLDLLTGRSQADLVRWLGARDPEVRTAWADRLFLRGLDQRQSIGHLSDAVVREHAERLLDLVRDRNVGRVIRIVAVEALLRAGLTDERLARAVCDESLLDARLIASLAEVDWSVIEPFDEWIRNKGPHSLVPVLVRCPGGFGVLERLAVEDERERAAAEVLRGGGPEQALRVWDAARPEWRPRLGRILARRSDGLGRQRLEDFEALGPDGILPRLEVSDDSVLDEWLALDQRWSLRRLRSFPDFAAPLLAPRHVDGFVEVLLDQTLPDRDRSVVCDLALRRPDLPFSDALRAVLDQEPDEFFREEVEAALLADPVFRRTAVGDALKTPVDEVSIALIDGLVQRREGQATGWDEAAARLLARVILEGDPESLGFRTATSALEEPKDEGLLREALRWRLLSTEGEGFGPVRRSLRVLAAMMETGAFRLEVAPLYAGRILGSGSTADPQSMALRFLASWSLGEAAERDREWTAASEHYRSALTALESIDCWQDGLFDLCRGEPVDGSRRSDTAFRACRPVLCQIRHLASTEPEATRGPIGRGLIARARSLAYGDARAEAEVAALESSIR